MQIDTELSESANGQKKSEFQSILLSTQQWKASKKLYSIFFIVHVQGNVILRLGDHQLISLGFIPVKPSEVQHSYRAEMNLFLNGNE